MNSIEEKIPASFPLPSLNDMSETKIEDLNDLVKQKIFSFIKPTELQKIRHVSKSWFRLINKIYGITAYIDNTNPELIQKSPWIVEAYLISLTRPVLEISFARRIRSLHLKKMIVYYNLFPLLQDCKYLQSLTFHDPEIDIGEIALKALMPANIVLNELKSLNFECWTFTEDLSTIIKLLSLVKFGKLEQIIFRSVHPPMLPLASIFDPEFQDNDGVNPLIKLIRLNLKTVRKVTFGTIIAQNTFTFIPNTFEAGGVVQIEELYLQNLYASWAPILQHQFNLKSLIIMNCHPQQWPELRTCITRCEGVLHKIIIEGRTFGTPWSCDLFEHCNVLEQLTLNISLSSKRHLQLLPKTLQKLELDGPITKTELWKLTEIYGLKELHFNSLGLNIFLINPITNNLVTDEAGHENPNMIDLRLFVTLLRDLPNLEILSFRDSAPSGLDWTKINEWTKRKSEEHSQFIFVENHFYDIHGRRIQHGLTFKLHSNFNRELFIVPQGNEFGIRHGLFGGILRGLFGIQR